MPRTTKLITVSLPPELAALAEKVAKEESRTKSELLREALREYVLTREVRREARRRLADIMARLQERELPTDSAALEKVVRDALEGVRRKRAAARRHA
jgi:metal-responsive CopG/Arc/MetJ family transcriptional regulator